ncbi:MFS transporter [Mucilaginibacter roseus]|uniref:MFS transporter n=1 Tax=Mucilaginibacter roseus TaxID=1528868 RepID=A0ABS8U550_9SPHI|nr:MFS transporter [Mucilaginibacter roseus]MCD8742240.1 MFS transporter [Mucilaginibacter roseus]
MYQKDIKPAGNYRWTICALLFVATTINYLDRQVLSLLQPYLEEKFGWTNSDYANITAVFQFAYALSMLFAGRIVDWLDTKWGYGWAIIIWSVAAMIHAFSIPIGEAFNSLLGLAGISIFSVSVAGFIVSRTLLAFGEAGNFPAAIKAVAEYFPKKERSFATGIFNSGANIGAVLAPLTIPWIYANWGWESAFILVGAFGFLWLIFWLIFYEKPEKQKRLTNEELLYITTDRENVAQSEKQLTDVLESKISWFKLLGYRQTWAFISGKLLTDGVFWFFLFWLPAYLKAQYNIVGEGVMIPLAAVYTLSMVGSVAGGWLPMHFIKKGHNVFEGRVKAMLVIAIFPLAILAAQPLGHISYWIPIVLIGVGAAAHQAWSANIFTTVSDMFPKRAIGSVVGMGGMAGGLGGVVVSKISGALFDHYKALGHIETGYTIVFTASAVAYLIAWSVIKTLVPKYKPVILD